MYIWLIWYITFSKMESKQYKNSEQITIIINILVTFELTIWIPHKKKLSNSHPVLSRSNVHEQFFVNVKSIPHTCVASDLWNKNKESVGTVYGFVMWAVVTGLVRLGLHGEWNDQLGVVALQRILGKFRYWLMWMSELEKIFCCKKN